MSEFIKCDGCGRMTKKKGDAAENWSIVAIKTCHPKSFFGDDYKGYHVCPECRKKVIELFPFADIEQAGGRKL